MTSVQNLRQLLSGNNLLLWVLLVILSLSSCDAFKKAQRSDEDPTRDGDDTEELGEMQGQRRYNPKTGKYEYVTEVTVDPDTVKWTVVEDKDQPPITSEGTMPPDKVDDGSDKPTEGQKLSVYNVAILMPFLTDKFSSLNTNIDSRSELALQFYSGAKLALEDLGSKGVHLNVSVLDTYASESRTALLLQQPDVQAAHLVIGPVKKSNLQEVALFAKKKQIPLVSPLNPSSGITADNPYYIQLSPSLQSHCETITRHIRNKYNPEQVVLVCRNKDAEVERLKYFQNANYAIEGSTLGTRFREYVVNDQSADFNEMDILPYIKEGETTVFVIPSWSNESFIYSLMRQIDIARGKNEVVIYGMPQWMDYERISYDYYERLNVHVSSASYIDTEDAKVDAFRKRFFGRYGMVPNEDAYIGYGTVSYFGSMIQRYGTRFQDVIDQNPQEVMYGKYKIERIAPAGATAEDKIPQIDHLENKFVHILKFKGYHFQPAD